MTNLIQLTDMTGGSAGVFPRNWTINSGAITGLTITTLAPSVINGLPSFNFSISGTPGGSGTLIFICADLTTTATMVPITIGPNYVVSGYTQLTSGALTGISLVDIQSDGFTSGVGYVSTPLEVTATPGASQTRFTATGVFAATSAYAHVCMTLTITQGVAIPGATISFAAPQLELGSTATAFESTPLRLPPSWSLLTPAKPALTTAQQAFFFASFSQTPGTVFEDKWHQPFSLPVWQRPALPIASQSTHVEPVSLTKETVTEDRWHQPLALPVWPPRGLAGFLAPQPIKPISLSAETVSVDRWLQQLSQPVARAARTQSNSIFWSGFTPVSSVSAPNGWLSQLSQPGVQTRQPQQQSFAIGYNIVFPSAIGSIFVIQNDQTMVALGNVSGMAGGSPFVDWMD